MTAVAAKRPWYREPYVWMVVGLPASAVIAGIITLIIAIVTFDGLVADDYYRRGLEINLDLRREQAAAEAGLVMRVSQEDEALAIDFTVEDRDFVFPEILEISLYHATRNGIDHQVLAYPVDRGRYVATIGALEAGRWHITAGTADWKLTTSTWSRDE
ncbi:MAG: FixH family protein [Gammaproteobacteria bacterium]|nr:FixH family protein [Gammaproteobacteria bacterium]NNM01825.1 FixH family protein [Gammaproteobacteria bacterium]